MNWMAWMIAGTLLLTGCDGKLPEWVHKDVEAEKPEPKPKPRPRETRIVSCPECEVSCDKGTFLWDSSDIQIVCGG